MGVEVQKGGKEPRSGGALMRLVGCLEVGSGWCFDALHVAGVDDSIADGILWWKEEAVHGNLRASRPDVAWAGIGTNGRRAVFRNFGSQLIRQSLATSSQKAYSSGYRS